MAMNERGCSVRNESYHLSAWLTFFEILPAPTAGAYRFELNAFNDDHSRSRGAVPHLAWFAVLLGIEPFFGALHRVELQHDDAFRVPIAFERFGRAAAYDVFAAILFHGRTGELLVFFVTSRIDNIDFNDHVSAHREKVKVSVRFGYLLPPVLEFFSGVAVVANYSRFYGGYRAASDIFG